VLPQRRAFSNRKLAAEPKIGFVRIATVHVLLPETRHHDGNMPLASRTPSTQCRLKRSNFAKAMSLQSR
jgi:hypothetical protein